MWNVVLWQNGHLGCGGCCCNMPQDGMALSVLVNVYGAAHPRCLFCSPRVRPITPARTAPMMAPPKTAKTPMNSQASMSGSSPTSCTCWSAGSSRAYTTTMETRTPAKPRQAPTIIPVPQPQPPLPFVGVSFTLASASSLGSFMRSVSHGGQSIVLRPWSPFHEWRQTWRERIIGLGRVRRGLLATPRGFGTCTLLCRTWTVPRVHRDSGR